MISNITIQYNNRSYTEETLLSTAKEIWLNDIGGSAIETMFLYLKPEEGRCYVVANGEPFSFGV